MHQKPAIPLIIFFIMLLVIALLPVMLGGAALRDSFGLLAIVGAGLLLSFGGLVLGHCLGGWAESPLYKRCDPDAFVKKTRRRLARALKRRRKDSALRLRLSLAAGLYAAGRFDEALIALPFPSQFKRGRSGRILQFMYHRLRFTGFIAIGVPDQAGLALVSMYDISGKLLFGKWRRRMDGCYRQDYYLYEMANGRFDGAEEAFRDAFADAKNTYQRVSAMLELGRVYAYFGRTDEARAAFEYVIAHGNKLHMVSVAREQLDALALRLPPP